MIAPTIYRCGRRLLRSRQASAPGRGAGQITVLSPWDTYRAAHPLYTFIEPERVNDMVKSFLAFFEQNGRLPVWNFQGARQI